MPDIVVAISRVSDGSMQNRTETADPVIVANRQAYLAKHGISMDQTTRLAPNTFERAVNQHETDWCKYLEVSDDDKGMGMRDISPQIADAIITSDKNHALLLPVADCVGTVIYDPKNQVLMVTHLGRHSLEQDGGIKSIQYLVDHHKSNPKDLKVWLTPAPNKKVFPIWALDNKGMKEVTLEQLEAAGVLQENVTDNKADTATDPDYFSYTEFFNGRSKEDGDHMIVAMMK